MNIRNILCSCWVCIFCFVLSVPVSGAGPVSIKAGGHINMELFYDSRQVISAREGNAILFPAPLISDDYGNDINSNPSLTFSLLTSRLNAMATGPELFGAKATGFVEIDFFGTSPDKYNLVRLRHAWVSLSWPDKSILAGQYWHPLFVTSCYPGMITFGAAVPYHVLNRAPQIRYSQTLGNLTLSGMLVMQNDFASLGPEGTSTLYARNSGMPELAAQFIFRQGRLEVGATGSYLSLKPRRLTLSGYLSDSFMRGFSGNLFAKVSASSFLFKLQGIYSENASHLVMLGGYGEASIMDPTSMEYSYSGLQVVSTWVDIESTSRPVSVGIFGGYSANLGTSEAINGQIWARGANISHIQRIAPRMVYYKENLALQLEVVFDKAAYGIPDNRFRFIDTSPAGNTRLVAAIKYFF